MSPRISYGLTLVTAAEARPVTRDEVKQHLRIDHDDDDTIIDLYIAAVTNHVEKYLQRSLEPQVWDLTLDYFPPYYDFCTRGMTDLQLRDLQTIEIPLPPLISVDSIRYFNPAGTEIELDADLYTVDITKQPGSVIPVGTFTWPTVLEGSNKVIIRFRAGYDEVVSPSGSSAGVESGVPPAIKAAIMLMIGDLFENRENVAPNAPGIIPMPVAALSLLSLYRIHALA